MSVARAMLTRKSRSTFSVTFPSMQSCADGLEPLGVDWHNIVLPTILDPEWRQGLTAHILSIFCILLRFGAYFSRHCAYLVEVKSSISITGSGSGWPSIKFCSPYFLRSLRIVKAFIARLL